MVTRRACTRSTSASRLPATTTGTSRSSRHRSRRPRCTRCRSTSPTSRLLPQRYAGDLPAALDLVHLGLGPDGHTASLLPGDPVLDVSDRLVAVTQRVPGLPPDDADLPGARGGTRARVARHGVEKREALARLLDRDTSIPAARIANPHQLVVCDEAGRATLRLVTAAPLAHERIARAVARSMSTPSSRSFTAMRSFAECTSFVASTASISLIGKKP